MRAVMLALALALTLGIQGLTTACRYQQDEYEADQKAYQECIENEPNINDCVYNYVKYLPENIRNKLED